jgi:hypothetical protein
LEKDLDLQKRLNEALLRRISALSSHISDVLKSSIPPELSAPIVPVAALEEWVPKQGEIEREREIEKER